MDRITKERRSWNMSRIRAKNTKPEMVVRSLLHKLGYRFRIHHIGLPGKPDIVLPKYRIAIFVHGCFWHRHPECKYTYMPKSREAFWIDKFDNNVKRDIEVSQYLNKLGWKVFIIWECETSDTNTLITKLESFLKEPTEKEDGYYISITT